MAAGAKSAPAANGTEAHQKPLELAMSLPRSPGTRIQLRLDVSTSSVLLFLTSGNMEAAQGNAALGSFVYAMPDVSIPLVTYWIGVAETFQRYNPTQPLSTPLYTLPSSQDFATRMAKLLARKTGRPCYVGSSITLSGAAGGGTVEEEMEAFRAIVDVVTTATRRLEDDSEDT
jgi:hypothetical protein